MISGCLLICVFMSSLLPFSSAAWPRKMFTDMYDLTLSYIYRYVGFIGFQNMEGTPRSLVSPLTTTFSYNLDDLGVHLEPHGPSRGVPGVLELARLAVSKTNNPSSTPRKSHATGAAVI